MWLGPTINNQLVTACWNGHVPTAREALQDRGLHETFGTVMVAQEVDDGDDGQYGVLVYPDPDGENRRPHTRWTNPHHGSRRMHPIWLDLTPLIAASWRGHLDILQLLLGKGVNPNTTTLTGFTALMAACYQRQHECVDILLNAGAQLDMICTGQYLPRCRHKPWEDGFFFEPIFVHGTAWDFVRHCDTGETSFQEHDSIRESLLQRLQAWTHQTHLAAVNKWVADAHASGSLARRLAECVAGGDRYIDCSKGLLDAGASISEADRLQGRPLLFLAVEAQAHATLRALVERGGSAAALDLRDSDGLTALELAASREDVESVQCLLDGGASIPDTLSPDGRRFVLRNGVTISTDSPITQAFQAALVRRSTEVRRAAIVESIAEAHRSGSIASEGRSLFEQCIKEGDALIESSRELVDLVGNLRNCDSGIGRPLVFIAAKAHASATLRLLVQCGANLNALDEHESTALEQAVRDGDLAAVQCLVNAGAFVIVAKQNALAELLQQFPGESVRLSGGTLVRKKSAAGEIIWPMWSEARWKALERGGKHKDGVG